MADRSEEQNSDRQIPKTINGHKIVRLLGVGGMGVVYEAEHKSFEVFEDNIRKPKRIAIKVARSHQWKQWLDEEAKSLSGASGHSNIVEISEVDPEHNPPYFVMDYLPNGSLEERIVDRPWSSKKCLELITPIASAIDHAHARGIIHNDIKPGNILFDKDDRPKLSDFGIATWNAALPEMTAESMVSDTAIADLTIPHMDRGLVTYNYAAPERFKSSIPGQYAARADIYSLAVIAHQLLTGRLPFELESNPTDEQKERFIIRVQNEPIPDVQEIHRAFQGRFNKALAKEPHKRYVSATSFVNALRSAAEDVQHDIEISLRLVLGLSLSSEEVLFGAEQNVGNEAVEKSFLETQDRNAIGLGAWSALSIFALLIWAYGLSDLTTKRPYLFRDDILSLLREGEFGLLGMHIVANPLYPLLLATLLLAFLICQLLIISSKRTGYLILWSNEKNKISLMSRLKRDAITPPHGLKSACIKLGINYGELVGTYEMKAKQLFQFCESRRLLTQLDKLTSGRRVCNGSRAFSSGTVLEKKLTRVLLVLAAICCVWIGVSGISALYHDYWQADLAVPAILAVTGVIGLIIPLLISRK